MTSIIRIYTHLVALSRPKIVTAGFVSEQMPAPPFGNALTDNQALWQVEKIEAQLRTVEIAEDWQKFNCEEGDLQ